MTSFGRNTHVVNNYRHVYSEHDIHVNMHATLLGKVLDLAIGRVVITLRFSQAIACLALHTCSAKADFLLFKVQIFILIFRVEYHKRAPN